MKLLMLFLFYTAAQLFMLVYSASKSAANRHTPWNSVKEYWGSNWPEISLRWIVATVLYFAILGDPRVLAGALAIVGLRLEIPVAVTTWYTAVACGLIGDRAADVLITALGAIWRTIRAKFAATP